MQDQIEAEVDFNETQDLLVDTANKYKEDFTEMTGCKAELGLIMQNIAKLERDIVATQDKTGLELKKRTLELEKVKLELGNASLEHKKKELMNKITQDEQQEQITFLEQQLSYLDQQLSDQAKKDAQGWTELERETHTLHQMRQAFEKEKQEFERNKRKLEEKQQELQKRRRCSW
ncbi:hypothetical protein BGX26_005112 [Mortierella sp. AD094]|nr:hypothetical protein BGX26_005112 [Mortierella sp. AD094]